MTCAAWISVVALILVTLIVCVVEHETKKRKTNVRLPRHVSWDRAARYYHDTH